MNSLCGTKWKWKVLSEYITVLKALEVFANIMRLIFIFILMSFS